MAVFYTADTHFGHGGAIGLYRRPFASVAAMDDAMIARWNETVTPGDDIWHLGDFALNRSAAQTAALLERLHGRKHLITGNNDGETTASLSGWASVRAYAEIEQDGRLVVLCHYAFRTWRGSGRAAVNLHGHSHGKLARISRQFDVGVDVQDFRPVTLSQLLNSPLRGRGAATGAA